MIESYVGSPTMNPLDRRELNELARQFGQELTRVRAMDLHTGNGSPEGVIIASVGALYTRKDGGAGTTLYVKESGTGNTGWVAK